MPITTLLACPCRKRTRSTGSRARSRNIGGVSAGGSQRRSVCFHAWNGLRVFEANFRVAVSGGTEHQVHALPILPFPYAFCARRAVFDALDELSVPAAVHGYRGFRDSGLPVFGRQLGPQLSNGRGPAGLGLVVDADE